MDQIPASEVEDRLLQACRTIRALPDPDRRFFHMHNSWPKVLQEVADAYGWTEAREPKFEPSHADVSDCLVALDWARGMKWHDFRFIWWRSKGYSFRAMAARIHQSDQTANRRYDDAIETCVRRANNVGREKLSVAI